MVAKEKRTPAGRGVFYGLYAEGLMAWSVERLWWFDTMVLL